jgi:hypothetical protein
MKVKINWVTILIVLMILGCKAPVYTIGMSESDFVKRSKAEQVEATSWHSIYAKTTQPFGKPSVTKYYYFKYGKLIEINEGQRQPDVIIQNKN